MRVNVKYQVVELKGSGDLTAHKELLFRDTLFCVSGFTCERDIVSLIEKYYGEGFLGDFIYSSNTKKYYKAWLKSFEYKYLTGLKQSELFQLIKNHIIRGVNQ